jgi:DNA-binding MarR family transcriptional regulator
MNEPQKLAQVVGVCRRAAAAAGSGLRVSELEVLLMIAGGTDTYRAIAEATGISDAHTRRALRFLSGKDTHNEGAYKTTRSSPFKLIEHRKHPHRRGFQWRLTMEGRGILSACLQLPPFQDWS